MEIDRDKARALGVTAAADRERPLHRLRLAPDLHHLRTGQPILGDPRGAARVPAGPFGACRGSTSGPPPADLSRCRPWPESTRGVGPLTVNHFGQLPAVTISFNLAPGISLGTAVEDVQAMLADIRLPATLSAQFPGSGPGLPVLAQGTGHPAADVHPGHLSDPGRFSTKASSTR